MIARFAACLLASLGVAVAAAERPNIVFVLADDLGPGDVGCYGGTLAPTPNLDRMAAEGIKFGQYYSAAPICSPSRAGIITGMFPARWNITSFLQTRKGNRDCEQADFLDPKAPSIARVLKEVGYATAHFGKWHLGGGRDVAEPPKFAAYGFDEHAGTWESPEAHPDITATNWIWSAQDKVNRWGRTAFFVDKAIDFLKRHKGQPTFVNLWLDDPHTPWVPDEAAQSPPGKGDTPDNLRKVLIENDRQIGRLLDGIRELGIDNDTLVIFTSDNGALPTFRGDRSAGLRGSKLSLYEGGIRLPFIARWPGKIPAGRVDENSMIAAVDLLPTFASLAGMKAPVDVALDGENLTDVLLGKSAARAKPLFWEYGRNDRSFAYPQGRDRSPTLAMREGEWKLLVNADGSGAELYNVVRDRPESTSMAAGNPQIVQRMTALTLAWKKSLPALGQVGAVLPAKRVDLSRWKLTLPVDTELPGRPDEITWPGLEFFHHADCFFANSQGDGVTLRAACGGIPTKGSSYPRCELREMKDRKTEAAWSTAESQKRALDVRLAITAVPRVKKHMVCAQIHDAEGDVLMVRLEDKKLFVEREGQPDVRLDSNYLLGNPFDLKIQAGGGRVGVWHNGEQKLDWPVSRAGCYFKAGCYTQSNPEKGDDSAAFGEVVIYRLDLQDQVATP